MLDVVRSTAPDPSATVSPFILIVKAQPDLTPRWTEPSVKTTASPSVATCAQVISAVDVFWVSGT